MPPDLKVPAVTSGRPTPGKRILQALPQYADSDVRHALYLPTDWKPGNTNPVLVEKTGNNGTVKGEMLARATGLAAGKDSCGSACLT